MGTQNLTIILAGLSLVAIGCDTSVKLEPVPAAPVVVEGETGAKSFEAEPVAAEPVAERVPMDKPVREGNRAGGYFGAIAGARRSAVERIESWPVTQAIQHYHASNGEYPKSHEEFMEKCWKPLKSPLPEVEEGYELRYDPEDHIVYKVPIGASEDTSEEK